MKELTFAEFYRELASSQPAPGGGSVAALCASLSAALLIMGMCISCKTEPEPHANEIDQLHALGDRGFLLANEDAQGFMQVIRAYQLPKATETEKTARSSAIQEALQAATATPMKISETGLELLRFAEKIAAWSKASCITDVALGSKLALVALEGGLLNVKINLKSIKDENFKTRVQERINEIARLGASLAMQAENLIAGKL